MLKQKKTWILLADGENARLIEKDATHSKLKQIWHFHSQKGTHHKNRNGGDTISYFPSARHAPEFGPENISKQQFQFAHDLIGYIQTANNNNKYDELYVFAPPSMLGYIRQNISHTNKNLKNKIKKFFNKDLIHLDLLKLKDYFIKLT